MTKQEIKHYSAIVEFLGISLGPDYEVVLHDLSTPDSSIVAIANGHISARTIGYPIKKGYLEAMNESIRENNSAYHFSYTLSPKGNKMLRSSTLYIKNQNDFPIGLLCINFDDSRYQELSTQLFQLCHPDAFVKRKLSLHEEEINLAQSNFTWDEPASVPNIVQEIIEDVIAQNNFSSSKLNQQQKILIMKSLNERGIFKVKGAVEQVALILKSSPASIYRYLKEIKESH